MSSLNAVIEKAMQDKTFCEELVSNPEATLKTQGIDASAEMIDAIKGLDASKIQELASSFDKNQAAS